MPTVNIESANFEADVLQAGKPVVVDFWAEWCGPCKMIAPSLEEISDELGEKVTIAKVNIDENQDVAAQFGVRSIPTLVLFKDGAPAAVQVGAKSKAEIAKWIEESA